jgi:hypothetical protein
VRALLGAARPRPVVPAAIVVAAVAVLLLPFFTTASPVLVTTVGALAMLAAIATLRAVRWRSLLALLIFVILFIPIRRYILPGHLPFRLEPYRLLVAALAAIWLIALLVDRRIKFRRTGLEGPLALFVGAALFSIFANDSRIAAWHLSSNIFKTLTFLFGFIVVLYIVTSVVRTDDDIRFLLKITVAGSAVVAVFAIVQARSGFNVFDHLDRVAPFLKRDFSVDLPARSGRLRAYASAEHPIALSALLAMMVPLAGFLAYTRRSKLWWAVLALIVLGCLSTVSRTGALMLVVEAVVFAVLRPRQAKRLWPALLPLLVAVHFALPGTLGSLRASFFPKGGIVSDQRGYEGTGRFGAARLDPTFKQIHNQPVFGIGYGTRIVGGENANALILDDQWLDTVLETGIVGAFAWIWVLVRTVRRLFGAARRDLTERGWLLVALAASITGYAVSMVTYDAFSFVQVTFVFYILLGLTGILVPARARAVLPAVSEVVRARGISLVGLGLMLWAAGLVLFVTFEGVSVRFVILVLAVLALGTWAAEAGAGRSRGSRAV